ncbi:hypothetical protein [Streptomyces sp. NPDC059788]|uniref:hypothetical protein n=1 Tax=Streptomyces sp. NPDC059788 TaxID=3346948 RepID=UPI0036567382
MGQSTDAMLVYGYHLGGGDSGWELEGLGKYGELPELPWYGPEDDFQTAAERHLLATLTGFTETWEPGKDGYFQREREARATLGVEFETHCSDRSPMYLLIAVGVTAHRGCATPVGFTQLADEVTRQGADAKLRQALDALGIRPRQRRPGWLLCSWWG